MRHKPGRHQIKTKILVVEDEILLLKAYVHLLQKEGYHVLQASTGEEARRLAREEKPDIVILDVVLPDADGIELCQQIKRDPDLSHIYVMLVSAIRRDDFDRTKGLQAGADSFVPRPVSNRELLAHIQSLVRLKQVETELMIERDFLKQITDISPVALTVVNREGVIIFANPQAERVLGLTTTEVEGRTYNAPAWQHTDYEGNPFPDEKQPFRQVMNTGKPVYDVRHAIKWPNGKRVLLSINGAPVYDEHGEIDRIVFSITDMTSHVESQAALKASEEKLQTVFNHIGDAVFIHDEQGEIWDVNQVACDRLRHAKEELKSTTLVDLIEAQGAGDFLGHLKLIKEQGAQTFESVFQRKDGTTLPVEIIGRRIAYEDQPAIISTARDITERKAVEAARARESEALAKMSKSPLRGVTAGAFGLRPLKECIPETYEAFIDQYAHILKKAVERRVYKVKSDISADLRALSEDLGFSQAGPRDVVELHVNALQRAVEGLSRTQAAAYADEGRLLVVELMGYLTSFYRHRAYTNLEHTDKRASQGRIGDADDQT